MENNQNNSGAECFWIISLLTTILLVILKVANVIDWSWWIVFSPLLAMTGIVVLGLILVLAVLVITAIIIGKVDKDEITKIVKEKLNEKMKED